MQRFGDAHIVDEILYRSLLLLASRLTRLRGKVSMALGRFPPDPSSRFRDPVDTERVPAQVRKRDLTGLEIVLANARGEE